MTKRILIFLLSLSNLCPVFASNNDQIRQLSLDEVIEIAKSQSYEAILAKHRFRGSYWEYKTYKAKFLPSLQLYSNLVNLNHSIDKFPEADGTYIFYEDFSNTSQAGMSLRQNVGLTGGNISVNSRLSRNDYFLSDTYNYITSPIINFEFNQPLNGYNEFKWEKIIEPMKYEEAKKEYTQAMERVSSRTIDYFFGLILAQINLNIAKINYANTDTLYKIANGRYNIGTISEDELLQMELSYLNSGLALTEAQIQLQINKSRLRSFLGYNESVDFELIPPEDIPEVEVDPVFAYEMAQNNNPEMLGFEQRKLEADRAVAQAKAEKGLNADLSVSLGLTQDANNIVGAYTDPKNQQGFMVGVRMPILDWGLQKGRYKMAQSAREVTRTSVQQSEIDFKHTLFINAMQFNLQDDQLLIAAKADAIADYRYYVTKQRFLIGNINVLDLNVALKEKDDAKRGYIQALKNYWQYYYDIRILTLYDFEKNTLLEENIENLY